GNRSRRHGPLRLPPEGPRTPPVPPARHSRPLPRTAPSHKKRTSPAPLPATQLHRRYRQPLPQPPWSNRLNLRDPRPKKIHHAEPATHPTLKIKPKTTAEPKLCRRSRIRKSTCKSRSFRTAQLIGDNTR